MSPGKDKLGVMGAVVVCEGATVMLPWCQEMQPAPSSLGGGGGSAGWVGVGMKIPLRRCKC